MKHSHPFTDEDIKYVQDSIGVTAMELLAEIAQALWDNAVVRGAVTIINADDFFLSDQVRPSIEGMIAIIKLPEEKA